MKFVILSAIALITSSGMASEFGKVERSREVKSTKRCMKARISSIEANGHFVVASDHCYLVSFEYKSDGRFATQQQVCVTANGSTYATNDPCN